MIKRDETDKEEGEMAGILVGFSSGRKLGHRSH